MKTTTVVGNTFIAKKSIETLKVKKTFKNGGGILGGCLKEGDRITVIGSCYDIDTLSFSTDITLNRLSESFFSNEQYFVKA